MARPVWLYNLQSTVQDIVSSQQWWRQQAWIIVTEILMGFLAAWGLLQDLSTLWVGLGLGVVYAINATALWYIRVYGRSAGIVVMILGLSILVISLFFGGEFRALRWYGLCASIGVLLAFRDNQNVTSSAWLPVRAKRRGGNNMSSLTISAILGAILCGLALYGAGWLSEVWKWLPHLLVIVAFGGFIPHMITQLGQGMGKHPSLQWRPVQKQEISWLLKLGTIFNAVNFLGRRLVIPAMILHLAQSKFGSDNLLPFLGAALGLVGVFSSIARAPVVLVGNISSLKLLKWGARLSLTGWAILCICLLFQTTDWGDTTLTFIFLLIGWGMMEFTNRTWSIAYLEQLRVWTVGPRFSAARAHRRSLHRFMVRKSAGGAFGCALGGLAGTTLAPAMVVLLLVGCWWMLEKMPNEK